VFFFNGACGNSWDFIMFIQWDFMGNPMGYMIYFLVRNKCHNRKIWGFWLASMVGEIWRSKKFDKKRDSSKKT
jgi:hypothetical protein